MHSFQKAIWTGLLPVSLFFMLLDFRTRVDRSYRYFCLALLVVSSAPGWAGIHARGSKVDEGTLSEYLRAGWP